ncbi:MAG: livF [Mycobacterium sp.]|nr:livF [Mycobacterium sp.]MCW2746639.1 livF [Mycobacterium sp.]
MTRLVLDGVSVRRGRAEVLRGVSLEVAPGEVVALLGSNGVGKSTTLRTISGLHRPTAGTIMLDATRLDGLRPEAVVRTGVAHVPEGRQVFGGLSVRENLELGARVRGPLTDATLRPMLDLFPQLAELLPRRAGVLSGGQQQMLAIARGLLSQPRFLLLDEPSLGLAPKVVADIARIVGELGGLGVGVLLVEQNATMALDVAARGYLMAEGRVVAAGTSDELRETDSVRAVYLGGRH